MSANLRAGGVEPADLRLILEHEAADVVALQELALEQARAIEAIRLYPHGQMDPRQDTCGLGLLSRLPASLRRLPMPRRDAWIAHIQLSGAGAGNVAAAGAGDGAAAGAEPAGIPAASGLEVINVHITPPHHLPPWRMLRQRRGQIRALRAHLASAPRTLRVLLGDLNSTPIFPAYRALARLLVDAALLAAARRGGRPPGTWGPRPGWPRLLRIDHALVHPAIEVEAARQVDLPGSDHAALLVDLLFPSG